MSALSPLFLWLIPLALLPVVIHLLNRLRYQTVRWAAMMFLRSADRDASRRAKIRQWLILAARCLMLLMVLLALARLQSKGRLARFLDPGSNLVVILFDRSASMERERGGVSARERALPLLQNALAELGGDSRVLWMDPATGRTLPLPKGVDLERLPLTGPTSTSVDMRVWLRQALAEVARSGVSRAEVWIPTDRQAGAWLPEGASTPDWSEWDALADVVTLRVLDVAGASPDPGNRALRLVAPPERVEDQVRVELEVIRDTAAPEAVPVRVDTGGLTFREDILVEGERFQWARDISLDAGETFTHARFEIPADSHPRDNEVAVAWRDLGVRLAGVDVASPAAARVFRAALLPRSGVRETVESGRPTPDTALWITDRDLPEAGPERDWVEAGGIWMRVPRSEALGEPEEGGEVWGVERWEEGGGVLATRSREPLRLDLVDIAAATDLKVDAGERVMAWMTDGRPLLTRRERGRGAVYRWATLPDSGFSNLDDGFVLVPVIQRMLREGAEAGGRTGTRWAGDVDLDDPSRWESLDGDDRVVGLDAGRYRSEDGILALNRPWVEDGTDVLSVSELEEWAAPFALRVFEDRSVGDRAEPGRTEFTGLLALLGLGFLVIESWLLTRNVRRAPRVRTAWEGAAS